MDGHCPYIISSHLVTWYQRFVSLSPNRAELWGVQYMSMKLVTCSAVGLACKAFVNSGLCNVTVNRLSVLVDALRNVQLSTGPGILTGEL